MALFDLDLGPRARTIFCGVFLVAQGALIATAGWRADRSYGFRMFADSSTVKVSLRRRLAGDSLVEVRGGAWEARDCGGKSHRFAWSDSVIWPAPSRLDRQLMAPYGTDAAIAEVRGALRHLAAHTPEDCETRALIADVTLRKNGWEWTARVETPRTVAR